MRAKIARRLAPRTIRNFLDSVQAAKRSRPLFFHSSFLFAALTFIQVSCNVPGAMNRDYL